MTSSKDIFNRYITKQKRRDTTQRQLIVDVFCSLGDHVSAEELYDIVKKHNPSVGQAAVYRALKLLSEAGIARSLDFGDGVARYEKNEDTTHNAQVICKRCGKTIEIGDALVDELQLHVARRFHFELTACKVLLYGHCQDCVHKSS